MTDTSLCCAPIINLWGAYWPAWVLCLVSGILLSLVSRFILSWTRLVPEVGSSRSAHRPRPRLILVRRFYPGLSRPIRDLAALTTCSGVKPSSRITISPGADAPKRSRPMIVPSRPT